MNHHDPGVTRLVNQQADSSEPSTRTGLTSGQGDDLLWCQLKTLPAFRALLRSVEARFYQQLNLSGPILDVGCGDGHFAEMAFDGKISAGIDPWQGPLMKAKQRAAYEHPIQGFGDTMPFPDGYFSSAISNSVLEHIPSVEPVLGEINRVLKDDGQLVITIPNDQFTRKLSGALFLERLGLVKAADSYRRIFNAISRHAHTDTPEVWAERLAASGFVVERWQNYFSEEALHALELGHIQGAPSAILHFITGHWILAPWRSSLRFTESWLRPYYEETPPSSGVMTLMLARKVSTNPVSSVMPPASPLSLSDLEGDRVVEPVGEIIELPPYQEQTVGGLRKTSVEQEANLQPDNYSWIDSPKITLILLLICIGGIIIGQAVLRNSASFQAASLPWFGISLVALLLYLARANRRQPGMSSNTSGSQIQRISRRRWVLLPAIIFVLVADRITNNASSAQAGVLGLLIWFMGIALAFYSLWDGVPIRFNSDRRLSGPRWEPIAVLLLFLISLFLRLWDLTGHPFLLSGSEASIGLDVAAVVNGQLKDPFAASWLSNPTMPAFLMALPLKLLGNSILGVRILSPFLGSLTVLLTYFLGRLLWGPIVGIVAGLLLAGSHVHIHYSRIGLTNVWDPLILLLAIGLIYLAWTRKRRFLWLMAGLFVGFSSYFYTASHLMPAILLGIAIYLLTQNGVLKENRHHILAAAILALIVALPQLLYYQANPDVFFERYRTLGILQGDWLVNELAQTGESAAGILTRQFFQGLLSFNFGIDLSNSYTPGVPLLSFLPSVLLLLGLGLALVKFKRLAYALLVVIFFSTVLGAGILLIDSPSSHRLLIALPFVCLLIASSLVWLGNKLFDATALSSKYMAPTLIAITLLITIGDVSFYFGRYRTESSYGDRNTEIAHRISDYLNSLDGQWEGYFFGAPSMYTSFPTFAYLVDGWQSEIRLNDVIEEGAPLQTDRDNNNVFLFVPERADELEQVNQSYQNGRLLSFPGSNANPLFYAFEIPVNNGS